MTVDEDADRREGGRPLGERLVGGGVRSAARVGRVAGVDQAVEALVEEAIVSAIGSPAVERALIRVAEEGKLQSAVERAVARAELREAVSKAIDSETADEIWEELLRSPKAQMLVERVANAPEVRNAITAQGFGLITDIGRQVSKITERLDDLLERIACRIIRQPERDAETNQAGLATRTVSHAIDAALLFVLFSVSSGLLASVLPVAFGSNTDGIPLVAAAIWLSLGFGVVGTYLITFWSLVGQTPGMRFLGIRLQHDGSDEIGFRRALKRSLAVPLSIVPAGLGMLYLLISPKRRAWHDHLAGTEVIYDEASAPWSLAPREWAEGDMPSGSSRAHDGDPRKDRSGS